MLLLVFASTVWFPGYEPTTAFVRGGVCLKPDECFGGHSGGETPGHIPNPEAKPTSADGTASERGWESRTPPDLP